VEVSALKLHGAAGLRGPTPLLRLQGDERLVALTRRGNQAAYEALVARYQSRLLAFCRHMLSSREDAEDVLQEVFAAAFNAMLADDRPINVRPWLYRIARNRCLNHLRKQTAIGVDSMDVHLAEHGTTTADKVHDREDFRELVADVQTLAETQRTALLLREIDALSYEQIAEAMETTVPSVKSLLVRARVSLAEAAEARKLTCAEVRDELGEWAEGLTAISAPVRRHVRGCQRCSAFKKQLKQTNRALAAVFPVGPLLLLKKFLLAQGAGGAGAAASTAAATGGVAAGGVTTGSALSAGVGAVATKAAAGLAAVAIVTTGAVEVDHAQKHRLHQAAPAQAVAAAPAPAAQPAAPAPVAVGSAPQAAPKQADAARSGADARDGEAKDGAPGEAAPSSTTPSAAVPASTDTASTTTPSTTQPGGTQEGYDDTRLPDQPATTTTASSSAPLAAVTPPPSSSEPQPSAAGPAPADTAPAPADQSSPTTTTAEPAPADPAPPADGTGGSEPSATTPSSGTPASGEPSSTTPAP
jgi:RNA polymerase sigma factor (sigma-70 family)